ncbi:MAG: hypothetical protein HS115_00990 [Spirochaetales bacterium]|nr:hypothetical protein [Spirochaetales bacterium]
MTSEPRSHASLPEPVYRARAVVDPTLPPSVPTLLGVENEGVYIGSVRPVFHAERGVTVDARVSINGGGPRPFKSGEILFVAGDYRLDLLATRLSNGKTRQSSTYFELRRAVVAVAEIKAATGASGEDARELVALFQAQLVATNLFTVPHQSQVDRVRTVMASGCNDTICAIEIGRGLDADYVLSGQLTFVRGQKILELTVSHIERNTVEFSEKIPYPARGRDREASVRSSTKKVAARILGLSPAGFLLPDERMAAIARSALFPGWGQLHEGQRARGLSLMGAGGLAAANTLFAYQNLAREQIQYNNTFGLPAGSAGDNTFLLNSYIFRQRKEQLLQAEANYNRSLYLLGGVWLFSLADIVFFPDHSQVGFSLSAGDLSWNRPDGPGWNLALHWAF